MTGSRAALITLRDGRTYAASSVTVERGRVRAVCRRFTRVGPAKACYLRDVKRRHQCDEETAKSIARSTWPRVQGLYEESVRFVINAGGFQ